MCVCMCVCVYACVCAHAHAVPSALQPKEESVRLCRYMGCMGGPVFWGHSSQKELGFRCAPIPETTSSHGAQERSHWAAPPPFRVAPSGLGWPLSAPWRHGAQERVRGSPGFLLRCWEAQVPVTCWDTASSGWSLGGVGVLGGLSQVHRGVPLPWPPHQQMRPWPWL